MTTKVYRADMKGNLERVETAQCEVCGYVGEYGFEVVDTETIDGSGHESIMIACKDITSCLDRKEEINKAFFENRVKAIRSE